MSSFSRWSTLYYNMDENLTAQLALRAMTLAGALAISFPSLTFAAKRDDSARRSTLWLRVATIFLVLFAVFAVTATALYFHRSKVFAHKRHQFYADIYNIFEYEDYLDYLYSNGLYGEFAKIDRLVGYMSRVAALLGNLVRIAVFALVFQIGLDTITDARHGPSNASSSVGTPRTPGLANGLAVAVVVGATMLAALAVSLFGLSVRINDAMSVEFMGSDDGDGVSWEFAITWYICVTLEIIFFVLAIVLFAWYVVARLMSDGASLKSIIAVRFCASAYFLPSVYNFCTLIIFYNLDTGVDKGNLTLVLPFTEIILGDWMFVILVSYACIFLRKAESF